MFDIENLEGSYDGFSKTGVENLKLTMDVIDDQGFEKFRFQLLNKIRFLDDKLKELTPKKNKSAKHLPALEEMFADKSKLYKLVEELKIKNIVDPDGRFVGVTGRPEVKGIAKQLIALSDLCKDFYKKQNYQKKELHHAWTSYFQIEISEVMFSEYKKPPEESEYHKLFYNLIKSL